MPLPVPLAGSIAVLQPYLFPYLGTFQLARQVEHFVFFDDVNFIRQGFIHRNAVLLDGACHAFTAPVRSASQNRKINEHDYVGDWRPLLDLLRRAYARAAQFDAVFTLIESVLLAPDNNVARKNAASVHAVFSHLGLPLRSSFASRHALPATLRGAERVRALCRLEGAHTYVNPAGGRDLYASADFEREGLDLRFCAVHETPYTQGGAGFVPRLSIIDVLMHCPPPQVVQLLDGGELQA